MRLIDANALKENLLGEWYVEPNETIFNHVFDLIDNAPTIELDESVIQEVLNKRCMTAVTNEYLIALHGKRPQGEWITHITYFECSNCKYCFDYDYAEDIDPVTDLNFNFCPNCGADMRGGAE